MEAILKKSAGCFVISKKNDKYYLLLQEKDWKDGKIGWVPPKGGIETNEPEKEAAKRETSEETGLKDMRIIKKLHENNYEFEKDGRKFKKTVIWFLAIAQNMKLGKKELTQHEIVTQNQVKWKELNEALNDMIFEDEKEILRQIIIDINNGKLTDI
ncbi:MAG TPA: NUDIX domain-containing protein [Candidatus Dojkabacteria bacterium]|nr:NUDIX domain-containing protein [Candidatus Dojkabacteria bacterium]